MDARKKLFAAALMGCALPARADFTYPGCAALASGDFTITTLVSNATDNTLREPTKMALTLNDQDSTDVYFVQRYGAVRKYDGTSKTLSTIANFNFGSGSSATDTNQIYNCTSSCPSGFSAASSSEGLQGIALDPDFRTNHWVYLYFCMKSIWKVTRYTLSGNSLDLATARTIIRFTHTSFAQHMGSALRFDAEGNLWVTVADNGGTNWPSDQTVPYLAAHSNKYFGKILRIRPRPLPDNQPAPAPGLGSTYDVPAGNLRQKFFDIGGPAGQDTNKILPEVYVMGTRNPYSIALDSVRKVVAWGDVGSDSYPSPQPDSNQWTEEFNIAAQPGFFGWPLWAGKRTPMPASGWAAISKSPRPWAGSAPFRLPFTGDPTAPTPSCNCLRPNPPSSISSKNAPSRGPFTITTAPAIPG
jgi:cytochrome c